MCAARHTEITQNIKFAISSQYLKKEVNDGVDFLHPYKHKSFLQIDTLTLMEMVKHSPISQNGKFAMSLQYLRKEVRDEVDFWYIDKHQIFLQDHTIITDVHDQLLSKYAK